MRTLRQAVNRIAALASVLCVLVPGPAGGADHAGVPESCPEDTAHACCCRPEPHAGRSCCGAGPEEPGGHRCCLDRLPCDRHPPASPPEGGRDALPCPASPS